MTKLLLESIFLKLAQDINETPTYLMIFYRKMENIKYHASEQVSLEPSGSYFANAVINLFLMVFLALLAL